MDAPARNPQEESIGDLFGQLIDDGRAVARAEVDLYKKIALRRAGRAKTGLVALVAGAILLCSALTAIIFGLVLGLALHIGPVAAGLVVAAVLGVAGYLLVRSGLHGVQALSGDEEEREALRKGEAL